jgi:hypothetical protein
VWLPQVRLWHGVAGKQTALKHQLISLIQHICSRDEFKLMNHLDLGVEYCSSNFCRFNISMTLQMLSRVFL